MWLWKAKRTPTENCLHGKKAWINGYQTVYKLIERLGWPFEWINKLFKQFGWPFNRFLNVLVNHLNGLIRKCGLEHFWVEGFSRKLLLGIEMGLLLWIVVVILKKKTNLCIINLLFWRANVCLRVYVKIENRVLRSLDWKSIKELGSKVGWA